MTEHTILNEPPWIVEIDGISYAVPEAVAFLLKDVSEERDTLKKVAERLSAETMAKKFHEYYEELAPSFDYETRKDTRLFDPNSPNGKLMIAVAEKVIADILEGKE